MIFEDKQDATWKEGSIWIKLRVSWWRYTHFEADRSIWVNSQQLTAQNFDGSRMSKSAKPGLGGFFKPPSIFRSCMAKAVQYFPQVRRQKKGGNHADIYDDMPWIPWIVQLALIQVLVGPLWRDPPVTCEARTFPGCLHSSRRCVWPVWGPWLIAGLVSWLKADFIQECHWKRVKGFWSGRRFFPHKSIFIIFLRWTSILIVILEGSRCPICWQAAHALRLANCERSSLLLLTWGEASGEPATGTACVLERGLLCCSSQTDYFIALYVYKYTVYIYIYILNICI